MVRAVRSGTQLLLVGFSLSLLSGPLLPSRALRAELSSQEAAQLKKELQEIIRLQNASRMIAFIDRLVKLDEPQAAGLLSEAAVAFASANNYQRALKALASFKGEKTVAELVRLATGPTKDFRQKVLILEVFGGKRDAATRKAVHDALTDKVPQVQIQGIKSVRARKEKEGIPVLIDLVEKHQKERDLSWLEAREALLALTGQDYQQVSDWRKFWEAKKDSIDPAKLGETKGPTQIQIKKSSDSVEFFGKEIHGQSVVFVVDCSGSMELYDDDPDFRGKNIEIERQRLRRAKEQCLITVGKLRGKSRFNIVTFNSKVFTWQKGIVPADSNNKEAARRFIQKFQANGLTHTDEAMEKAFEDPAIDSIVLLSDGAPAKQNGPSPMELQRIILARVKDLNSSRKLRIDTFGFEGEGIVPKKYGGKGGGGGGGGGGGDNAMIDFLKKLAKENGGEYQSIK